MYTSQPPALPLSRSSTRTTCRHWAELLFALVTLLVCWGFSPAANAATGSCDVATGRGATGPVDYAKYCWIDFTGYNDSQARSSSGQNFTIKLPSGTLTFNLKASGSDFDSATLPLYVNAPFDQSAFTGIPGKPGLYQTGNGTTTLKLSNLTVHVNNGELPYTFVAVDAETTNTNETLTFKQTGGSNWQILTKLPNGNSTVYPSLTGVSTAIVKEAGVNTGKVGAYAFANDFPSSNTIGSVTATMVGGGKQGVAFGIKYHAADLAISSTHSPANFKVGGTGSYTLSVHNNGPEKNHWNAGDTTTVTDTLPAGLSYVAAGSGGSGWSCSAAGQVVTCTSSASVNSGNDMSPITISVQVDSNGNNVASSVTNTATVSNIYDYVSTNNTANDVTPIVHSSLVTSTKVASDLNGGEVEPGDVIQYTLTLTENHGVAANGVSVVDNLTNDVGSLDVVSSPTGSTDSSTTSGGTHGNGQVNITGIDVPANGSVQIVYRVTVANSAAAGSTYTNTANIANPDGTGSSPSASFSVGAPPANGNKVLYIFNTNDRSLERTPQTEGKTTNIKNNAYKKWTLSPALAKPLKLIGNSNIGITLLTKCVYRNYYSQSTCYAQGYLKWTAALYDNSVSGANRIGNISGNVSFNSTGYQPGTATIHVPAGGVTIAKGHKLILQIHNNSNYNKYTQMTIQQQTGLKRSYVTLNTSTVINVDSVKVYSKAYPATTQPANYTPGQKVYIRAVVSDPFGSFDIDPSSNGVAPTLTIKGSNGTTQQATTNMTRVADSGAGTKTFEYAYTLPPSAAKGYWTPSVKATEGEASIDKLYNGNTIITHTASGAFDVESPSLVLTKTVKVLSDPSGHTPPHALPGATVQYTIRVQNNGQGQADSIKLTDKLDRNVNYQVGSASFADGSPSSNLSFSPTGDVQYCSNTNSGCTSYTTSVGNGNTDPNIRKIIFTPSGRLAGKANAAAPTPNFSIHYKAKIH